MDRTLVAYSKDLQRKNSIKWSFFPRFGHQRILHSIKSKLIRESWLSHVPKSFLNLISNRIFSELNTTRAESGTKYCRDTLTYVFGEYTSHAKAFGGLHPLWDRKSSEHKTNQWQNCISLHNAYCCKYTLFIWPGTGPHAVKIKHF